MTIFRFFLTIQFALFILSKAFSQAPANDLKQNATTITASTVCNAYSYQGNIKHYDLTNATGTGGVKDVWYKFTATFTDYEISYIYKYDVGFDVSGEPGTYADVSDNVFHVSEIGKVYYIRFYSITNSNQSGYFCLYPSVENDEKSIAKPIADNACISNGYTFNNATKSIEAFTCNTSTDFSDVWYTFTATSTAYKITANTNTGYTFHVQVTDQSDIQIGCGSGILTSGKAVATINLTNLIPENKYYIRIIKYNSNGDYSMNVCLTPQAGTPYFQFPNTVKTYGDANFSLSINSNSPGAITYSIISGSQYANVTSDGNVSIIGAGQVTIQASQEAATGYLAGTATSSLTIQKATLTAKADNLVKDYNTSNPELTLTYTGIVNNDIPGINFIEPSISTNALITSNPGTYPIYVSGTILDNYNLTTTNGILTINKLTPTLTYTGETIGKAGATGISLSANSNSPGTITYEIIPGTASGYATGNIAYFYTGGTATLVVKLAATTYYSAASITQELTITADVTPTVTFEIPDKEITDAPFTITAISNSPGKITYYNDGSPSRLDITQEGLITLKSTGYAFISFEQEAAPGFKAAYGEAMFYISYATPELTYTGATSGYVGDIIPLSASTTSDASISYTITNQSGSGNISGNNLSLTGAGTFTLTIRVASTDNYYSRQITQTITVNNIIAPTITFNTLFKTYGDEPFNPGATSNSNGALTYTINPSGTAYASMDNSTGLMTIKGAGTVQIQINQAADGQYSAAVVYGTIYISKKTLIVKADNKTRAYNTENPPLTISYQGFVYGETEAIMTTVPIPSTNATINSNAGSHIISLSAGAAPNYTVTTNNGLLTITKIQPELIYTGAYSGVVGNTISAGSTSNSGGTISYSFSSASTGIASVSGNVPNIQLGLIKEGTFIIIINLAGTINYNPISQTITINIHSSTDDPDLTLSDITKTYADAPFTLNAESNSSGAITYTIISGNEFATVSSTGELTILKAGTVVIQTFQAADGGFNSKTIETTLIINKAEPSLTYTGAAVGLTGETINLSATSNSSGAIIYSITNDGDGTATISNDLLNLNTPGTVYMEVKVEAEANYNSKAIIVPITINQVTSVNKGILGNLNATVFPVPAIDYISLDLSAMEPSNGSLVLYTTDGIMIKLIEIGYLQSKIYTIPVNSIESGLYLLKLETSQGYKIWKVVK